MKAGEIYLKYKECVDNVHFVINRYEKYKHCFSLASIDNQIQPIFHKICYAYAKMMILVNHDTMINTDYLASTFTYEDCEEMVKNKFEFIGQVAVFLKEKQDRITIAIERMACLNDKNCLNDLQHNVKVAQQLKDKMEVMIKTSQYIHHECKLTA